MPTPPSFLARSAALRSARRSFLATLSNVFRLASTILALSAGVSSMSAGGRMQLRRMRDCKSSRRNTRSWDRYLTRAGFEVNVTRGSASRSAFVSDGISGGLGSADVTPGSPGPGTITHRASCLKRGNSRTSSASLSKPLEYSTKPKCVGPNGLDEKSPISTNMEGMASSESNPSNTVRSLVNVDSLSSHTSDSTTNMSLVLAASSSTMRSMSFGRSRPAPMKSTKLVAFLVSSLLSAGGNPRALTSNTPSALRTSPSATTMQFSVYKPDDVAAFDTSTWICPVRSSRKNRSSSSCERHPMTYLVPTLWPRRPVSGVSSQ